MSQAMMERIEIEVFTHADRDDVFYLDSTPLTATGGTHMLPGDDVWAWETIQGAVNLLTIDRGPTVDGVQLTAQVGTATVRLIDPPDEVYPNTPIRITGDGVRLFTGRVLDTHETEERLIAPHDPSQTHRVVTLIAVDRVQEITNRNRYGAVITSDPDVFPLDASEMFTERIDRYLRPTGWEYSRPGDVIAEDWGWFFIYPVDYQVWGGTFDLHANRRLNDGAQPPGFMQFVPDVPGEWFHIEAAPSPTPASIPDQLQVAMILHNPNAHTITVIVENEEYTIQPGQRLPIQPPPWQVANPSWDLQTYISARDTFNIIGLQFVAGGECARSMIRFGSIGYESTLANHLDLTVNTVSGAWWIDTADVIRSRACRHGHARAPVHLSDTATPSYVDIVHDHGTTALVNDLALLNHSRAHSLEDGRSVWSSMQTSLGPWTEPTHAATYGPRIAALETAILDTPYAPFESLPDTVAASYLPAPVAEYRRPRQVTIYHKPGISTPKPDVMDALDVTRAGTTHQMLACHISHTITPEAWHQDITLIDQEST